MTICTNPDHPFRYPPREHMYRDLCRAKQHLEQQRAGYVGGIAYALRLLNSPSLNPDRTPVNMLAGLGVLAALLDGHADQYISMANKEMKFYRACQDAERRAGEGE